jgi:hypothetical protein
VCEIDSGIKPDGNPCEVVQDITDSDTQCVLSHVVEPILTVADADESEPKWTPKTLVYVLPTTGRFFLNPEVTVLLFKITAGDSNDNPPVNDPT